MCIIVSCLLKDEAEDPLPLLTCDVTGCYVALSIMTSPDTCLALKVHRAVTNNRIRPSGDFPVVSVSMCLLVRGELQDSLHTSQLVHFLWTSSVLTSPPVSVDESQ